VADEGESVWLYLTEAASSEGPPRPVADCWLYNRVDAPTVAQVQARRDEYRAAGTPPPAPAEVMKPEARRANSVDTGSVQLVWSDDGASVAAWVNGQLTGFIVDGERRGYSANLVTACPWGQPVDMERYKRFFDSHSLEP